jgi:hypothetical protein
LQGVRDARDEALKGQKAELDAAVGRNRADFDTQRALGEQKKKDNRDLLGVQGGGIDEALKGAVRSVGFAELHKSLQESLKPTGQEQQARKQADDIAAMPKVAEQQLEETRKMAGKVGMGVGAAMFGPERRRAGEESLAAW